MNKKLEKAGYLFLFLMVDLEHNAKDRIDAYVKIDQAYRKFAKLLLEMSMVEAYQCPCSWLAAEQTVQRMVDLCRTQMEDYGLRMPESCRPGDLRKKGSHADVLHYTHEALCGLLGIIEVLKSLEVMDFVTTYGDEE